MSRTANTGVVEDATNTSKFSSIDAAARVAAKIVATNLLPPHSRTLAGSQVNTLLSTTALYSNKSIKEFYPSYAASALVEKNSNIELVQKKLDIQRTIDKHLSLKKFLDNEALTGQFRAAFEECLHELDARRRRNDVRKFYDHDSHFKLTPNWPKVAEMLWLHGDFRGNLKTDNTAELLNRRNWYPNVKLGRPRPPHASRVIHPEDEDGGADPRRYLETLLADKYANIEATPLTTFDIALLGGMHPRTFWVERAVQRNITKPNPKHIKSNDTFFESAISYLDNQKYTGDNYDLGTYMFAMELPQPAAHSSYLVHERTKRPQRINTYFGADRSEASSHQKDADDDEQAEEEDDAVDQDEDQAFSLYVEQCFGRGVQLYIHIVHACLGGRDTRAGAAPNIKPDVLTNFARLIGLTIQQAELGAPRINSMPVSSTIRALRENSIARQDAWIKLTGEPVPSFPW